MHFNLVSDEERNLELKTLEKLFLAHLAALGAMDIGPVLDSSE